MTFAVGEQVQVPSGTHLLMFGLGAPTQDRRYQQVHNTTVTRVLGRATDDDNVELLLVCNPETGQNGWVYPSLVTEAGT